MLRKFKQRRLETALTTLIDSGDLQLWPKLKAKLTREDLTTELQRGRSALELCIANGHHRLFGELLHCFPELSEHRFNDREPIVLRVLAAEQSLALLSAMLTTGLDPNSRINNQTLVEIALEQPSNLAMLLVNRLVQHGAQLHSGSLIELALQRGDQPLIKFLVDSGAPLSLTDETAYDAELVAFAKRCFEDKKLRDLWA